METFTDVSGMNHFKTTRRTSKPRKELVNQRLICVQLRCVRNIKVIHVHVGKVH